MRQPKIVEAGISRRILERAREVWPHIAIRKRHVSMGTMGDPDVYGSLFGRHFEIEVKRPGNGPTKLQTTRLEQWHNAGAITGVAHSVEEAIEILKGAT